MISRAPFRLGLAGGGTDVVPYCFENEGAVVNVTINKYCHVSLKEAIATTFHSIDLQKEEASRSQCGGRSHVLASEFSDWSGAHSHPEGGQ